MTRILRSTDANNAAASTITEAQFQDQMQSQVNALRQLVGNADINAGSSFTNPLNSPYTLYVDPTIGRDDWEGGSFNTNSGSRMENQRLVCGYSPNRPFRTLNRAVIEAAILTSKTYLNAVGDLVTIFCAPGEHLLLNGAGDANTSNITSWGTSLSDSNDAAWNTRLLRFNDPEWGLILPRGVTICGWDLRKTVIRPTSVPSASGFTRRRMLRVTSDCYFFGFSFKDAIGVTTSHHNLACFGFAGRTALDLFYSKIFTAFPAANSNIDPAKIVTLNKEYEITGPAPEVATESSDTTNGSSPYIFNCSLRSNYGMSGADLDGSLVTGLKSLVVAQFTNVSLQKDINAFQKYSGGDWINVSSYQDYINTDINNLRFKVTNSVDYRHFALRCSNGAFMQAVSIFAIGDAVHHWCESGGEITLTNSNSNFGAQASLAVGFRGQGSAGGAFPQDDDFQTTHIRRAKAISTDGSNIRRIYLGTVATGGLSSTQITLNTALDYKGLLTRDGYSLKENDYIWIENSDSDFLNGADFRAQLAASPWTSNTPTTIQVKNNGNSNFSTTGVSAAAEGNRVYIRRLVDDRLPEEREYAIIVQNSGVARRPQNNYVIRLGGANTVAEQLDPTNGGGEVFIVSEASVVRTLKNGSSLALSAYKVVPSDADNQQTYAIGQFYRKADVVVHQNRYYRCVIDHESTGATPDNDKWTSTLSNIPVSASGGGIEAARSNIAPPIRFDGDTSNSDVSTTLGWDLSLNGSSSFLRQLRSATDYRTLRKLLIKLGYASGVVDSILHPVTETARDYDIAGPSSATPTGGKLKSGRAPWPLQFNRPSVCRSYGLAYEWVGYQNYSKALPKYQVSRLSEQQGLDVLAVNVNGGRCYNQGTTEEGLVVTPYVVQDLGTGREFSTATAGLGGLSGDVDSQAQAQTQFDNLTVRGELTTTDLVVERNIRTRRPTTTQAGVTRVARLGEVVAPRRVQTDAQLDIVEPAFITPESLEYWRAQRGITGTSSGVSTTVYVVPDNAAPAGIVVFDGNSAVLSASLSPQRTGSELLSNPPTTADRAVTITSAIEFANRTYSPTETVTYRLANGAYTAAALSNSLRKALPAFNHIANIVGATSRFPSTNALPDSFEGTAPATNVKQLVDSLGIPCFASPISVSLNTPIKYISFFSVPLRFTFKYGGSINGVAWESVEGTLAKVSTYPGLNSYQAITSITENALRTARESNPNSLKDFLVAYLKNDPTIEASGWVAGLFYSNRPLTCQSGSLIVSNCVFGAQAPGTGSISNGLIGCHVFLDGDADLTMRGVYLLGNTRLAPGDLAGVNSGSNPKNVSVAASALYGHRNNQSIVAGLDRTRRGIKASIRFDYAVESSVDSEGKTRKDFDVNCIHVLNNEGNYGTSTTRTSTTGTRGATFVALIGDMPAGSTIFTGGYNSYQSAFTQTNRHHGIAGVFGNAAVDGTGEGPVGISGAQDPLSFFRFPSYNGSLWQQARTGTRLTLNRTGVTYGTGRQENAYTASSANVLNIKTSIFFRGVDTSTAQVVGGSLETVTIDNVSRDVFYG